MIGSWLPTALTALTSALLLLPMLCGCAPKVQNDSAVGSLVTPGNTQIPLPPGDWKLLSSKRSSGGYSIGGGTNNQGSTEAEYAMIDAGLVKSLAYVATSDGAPIMAGYVTGRSCIEKANAQYIYFQEVRADAINDIDCTKVTGSRVYNPPNGNSSDVYREAYEKARAFNGLPRNAVEVNFAQARNGRFVNYFISFFPERDGLSTRTADWRVGDMKASEQAYVTEIVNWSKRFRNAVRLGTENQLK